ncbi:MAG: hypothetical protein EOO60_02340 [Hymenobacter sp.]|nr:MAG: hypothetical protein EOO60_02340 [Hymenobacter sp.]
MKHILLIVFTLTCTTAAQAQVNSALVNGLVLGTRLAMRGGKGKAEQKPELYVTPVTYQAQTFLQKRTPAKKLPKADVGGTEITAIEQLLSTRYAALQADSTSVLLSAEQEKEFSRLRNNLQAFNPTWSADAYLTEMNFYRQQDVLRKQRIFQVAK